MEGRITDKTVDSLEHSIQLTSCNHTIDRALNFQRIAEEMIFNERVSIAVIKDINKKFGHAITQLIQCYINIYDLDLYKICEEPQKISELLYRLFGSDAGVMEREIIRAAYNSFGLQPVASDNLSLAITKLRVYSKIHHMIPKEIEERQRIDNIRQENTELLSIFNKELDRNSDACKLCDKSINVVDTSIEGLLANMCNNCWNMQNELVVELLNEDN